MTDTLSVRPYYVLFTWQLEYIEARPSKMHCLEMECSATSLFLDHSLLPPECEMKLPLLPACYFS